jgi:hypothetical protein
MALWSNTDANTSAPKFAPAGGLGVSANGFTMFSNTTADAFVTGATLGVFGVDTAEQQGTVTSQGGHAGWVLRKTGSGGRAGRVSVETIVARGSMSGDAEDVVYPDATITIVTQPQSEIIPSGNNISLSVVASVVPVGTSLTYQWYDVTNNSILASNTATTLNVTDLTANASYNVIVSATGAISVSSDTATIEVQ